MQIFIDASTTDHPLEAQRWVSSMEKRLFAELAEWVLRKEKDWGAGYVFIESTLPRPARAAGRRNQVDLLVSFSDRIALCELKSFSHAPGTIRLGECCAQVNGQLRRLERLLDEGEFEQYVAKFLFLPDLNADELAKVSDRLDSPQAASHIWPVGGRPELKAKRHGDRPLYFIDGLNEYLSSFGSANPLEQARIQEYLHGCMIQDGAKFRSFDTFPTTKAYLQTISTTLPVLHDEWYVPGAREDELLIGQRILADKGLVIIVGPPGIGKSTLARELLQISDREFCELSLPKDCRTSSEICHRINYEIRGESSKGLGADSLLQHLAAEDYIFWIRRFEETSTEGIQDLLQKYDALRRSVPDRVQATWIIESTRSLVGLEDHCQSIAPLANENLSRILESIRPGGAYNDSEDVIRLANGNPDRARRLWQSKNRDDAKLSDEFKWFCRQLSSEELRVLSLLCLASSKSPLGISTDALTKWSIAVSSRPPSHVKRSIDSLLELLERHRLARVTRFSQAMFEGLLDTMLPEEISTCVVSEVSFGLTDGVLKTLDKEKQDEWQEVLQNILMEDDNPGALAHVTLGFDWYDLEPFYRSSFRFTTLSKVLGWIERTRWDDHAKVTGQYLLRAMRLLTQIRTGNLINVEDELGQPDRQYPIQCFAYESVKARATLSIQLNDPDFDLSAWLLSVERHDDQALVCELLVGTAMSVQHSTRFNKSHESWEILNRLWERFECGSAPRCQAMYQALAFLNRAKARTEVVSDSEAYDLFQRLSRELVETGIRLNNIQLLCEALFYLVRSQEFRKGRTSYSEVLGYRAGLKFIEEYQARTVMRLQTLLTQGSVHRHFCRDDKLLWSEFKQHMDDGLKCYGRALKSALAHNHVLHILNAVAYMMDFCLKALRFTGDPNARVLIAEACCDVLHHTKKAEPVFENVKTREERNILASVKHEFPLLLYITCISDGDPSELQMTILKDHFRASVDETVAQLEKANNPKLRMEFRKTLRETLKRLHWTLNAGQSYEPIRNKRFVEYLSVELYRLLVETKSISTTGDLLPLWRRTAKLLASITATESDSLASPT